ncbi:putative TonB-dependent receptor [Sphingomonas changbaiensis NBRC 104936]|uniref:Putative TonB-dependent receptor n=1 Tax=Sphingomonas changbaiensis NBRC 104936 TaxID=1219043 RepID=A0A0E9MMR4_9SPHN|nr:TonB-dependent receptor [Sphingomonas changbaiensis]GAO38400.1 putative TonB-dependent receptor [Sphingomonas changbaiensis NBRC 104936]
MRFLTAAGALGALVAANPALADSAPPGTIVVTGDRLEDAQVATTPGGTDLVTADDYRDKAAVSLRDALAFSPGVYAQPRFGQEVRLSIRGSGISRGFHMRGLTLLQDGIPINLADDNGDFQELDPLIFERIEVYRGVNALRFGGSTLGGAINAITPTGRTAPGVDLRVDGGSFDSIRGKLAAGFASGPGDGWLALTGDSSDGDREHARRNALRLNANFGLKLGEGVETRFYASGQSIRQELPGSLPLDIVLTRPKTGVFRGDQQRNIDSIRLQNRTTVDVGPGAFEFGAFLNAKKLDHPIFQVVDQKSTDYGVFARLNLSTGPLSVLIGTTGRFGTVASRRSVNMDGRKGALTFDAGQRAETIDAYGEARYQFGTFSVVAGAIYTHAERRQRQTVPSPALGEADYDQFSPKLGLLWEPREALQFYANYSRSHELPGFIELAQVASFVPLKAQTAWTAEAGARGTIGPARFDVSIYRATLKGEMLQFNIDPAAGIPAATFNAGHTLHQGIEAGLDLDLTPWARLRQVYQLNDFRFRSDPQFGDNRLPVIPKHLYRAELRIGGDTLNVAPSLEWVPHGAWADYANTLRVGGYVLLGATAEAQIRPGLSLFVDARNLTNRKQVGDVSAVVNYAALPGSQQAIFYPVERRAIFGGLRANF